MDIQNGLIAYQAQHPNTARLFENCSDDIRIFSRLQEMKNGKRCLPFLQLLVAQNHYVTSNSVGALTPGLTIEGNHRPLLLDYIRSETGHSVFTRDSLSKLGVKKISAVHILPETKMLMSLLASASRHSIFTMACFIDIFERGSTVKKHPLMATFEGTSLEAAMKPLQTHRDINFNEQHDQIGRSLATTIDGVSWRERAEAELMIRELASSRRQLSASLFEVLEAG